MIRILRSLRHSLFTRPETASASKASRAVFGRAFYLAAALPVAIGLSACRSGFNTKQYTNPDVLFNVGLREYKAKRWGNAAKAFDQLTRDLPARDPLLPPAYFYLGKSQEHDGDHLLAAQSFGRIADAFPDDTLADDAMLESGLSYSELWRKPELDPQYGQSALNVLQSLVALYPDSPLIPKANAKIAELDNRFAEKDLRTAVHYMKRDAFDSAIIYLKDIIRLHPTAPAAREAYLYMVDAYRAIRYTEDARDACDALRKNYPNDREVRAKCGSASSAAASTPHT